MKKESEKREGAGNASVTDEGGICQMLVGHRVDEHGDPGEEIWCHRSPAPWLVELAAPACDSCAEVCRKEGLRVDLHTRRVWESAKHGVTTDDVGAEARATERMSDARLRGLAQAIGPVAMTPGVDLRALAAEVLELRARVASQRRVIDEARREERERLRSLSALITHAEGMLADEAFATARRDLEEVQRRITRALGDEEVTGEE